MHGGENYQKDWVLCFAPLLALVTMLQPVMWFQLHIESYFRLLRFTQGFHLLGNQAVSHSSMSTSATQLHAELGAERTTERRCLKMQATKSFGEKALRNEKSISPRLIVVAALWRCQNSYFDESVVILLQLHSGSADLHTIWNETQFIPTCFLLWFLFFFLFLFFVFT